MHAVLTTVKISEPEGATRGLREEVVPAVKQAPGFVTGHWTWKDDDDSGVSMVIFESEEAAKAMSERIAAMAPDEVTVEKVEVREVVAHA